MTPNNIISQVESLLLREAYSVEFAEVAKLTALGRALLTVQTDVLNQAPSYFMASATIAWVSGTTSYALPTGFKRAESLYVLSGVSRWPIHLVHRRDLCGNNVLQAAISGAATITILGPVPTGTVTLEYIGAPTIITSSANDDIGIPDPWCNLIVWKMAAYLLEPLPQTTNVKLQWLDNEYRTLLRTLSVDGGMRSTGAQTGVGN